MSTLKFKLTDEFVTIDNTRVFGNTRAIGYSKAY